MSSSSDGGRTALMGFLYQAVATSGIEAWASCSDASTGSDELDAVLAMTRIGELHHEYFDSDIAVENKGECAILQLKYSRQIPPPTIGPEAVIDIVDTMHKSVEAAKSRGANVTKFVLVSNRSLGPQAVNMVQAAAKGLDHEKLTEEYHYAILSQLASVPDAHWSEWENKLIRFAEDFGTERREISKGIEMLVARVVRETVEQGQSRIVKHDLIEAFTGTRHALPLLPGQVIEHSVHAVQKSPAKPGIGDLRRDLLDELMKASLQRALIVLCGQGGCGKTVALWQWARDLVTNTPLHAGAFTVILPARRIGRFWMAREVSSWANLAPNSQRRQEDHYRAFARLYDIANPSLEPPIFHLALDGLDEEIGPHQEEIIRQTLEWFQDEDRLSHDEGRPPRATLVVTCREPNDIIGKWLQPSLSGFPYHGIQPEEISVDDFAITELEMVAKQSGLIDVYERVRAKSRFYQSQYPESFADYAEVAVAENMPSVRADEEILQALRHPVMWGALLELGSSDQLEALEGGDAVTLLADAFVQRFFSKLLQRGNTLGLNTDQLLHVFNRIACYAAEQRQLPYADSDWVYAAGETGLVNRIEARALLREALSGGLIIRDDATHWRWRHRFVGDYLVATEIV